MLYTMANYISYMYFFVLVDDSLIYRTNSSYA